MTTETKQEDSIQIKNIEAFKEIFDNANKDNEVRLIDTIKHLISGKDFRLFYDPLTRSFLMGPDASIEGFVLQDGTVLEDNLIVTKPCFIDNVININIAMFETAEDLIGYAQNLWMAIKLFVVHSNELDPSFATYTHYHNVIFGERGEDAGETTVISDYSLAGVGFEGVRLEYVHEAKAVRLTKKGTVLSEHPLQSGKEIEDEVLIATAIEVSRYLEGQYAASLHNSPQDKEEGTVLAEAEATKEV